MHLQPHHAPAGRSQPLSTWSATLGDAVALWCRDKDAGALQFHEMYAVAGEVAVARGGSIEPARYEAAVAGGFAAFARSSVLERVCAVIDQPVILLKGAELASYYPSPGARPSGDIDILCANAGAAHRQLRQAGFRSLESVAETHHHLPTLAANGAPVAVDVHRRLGVPDWMVSPRVEDLFVASVVSRAVPGAMTLHPAHHAVYVAAHAWRSWPLAQMRPLLDVATLMELTDRPALVATAEAWRAGRIWKSTVNAIESFLLGTATPTRVVSYLGGHLAAGDSPVHGRRVSRWGSALAVTSPRRAVTATAGAAAERVFSRPWVPGSHG